MVSVGRPLAALLVPLLFLTLAFGGSVEAAPSAPHHIQSNAVHPISVVEPTVSVNSTYKPVFFMHGVGSNEHDYDHMLDVVRAAHPGQFLYALDIYDGDGSLLAMWTQVYGTYELIKSVIAANPGVFDNGYHLVCHSQGTLVCRGMISAFDDHQVDTFVSLAGPHRGEYGPFEFLEHLLPNVTVPNVYRILYTPLFQNTLSVANYWNDPLQQAEYLANVKFLPWINNEIPGKEDPAYKTNFLKVNRVALFGSPDDGIILPWYSSMFEFYNDQMERIPLEQQYIFVNDTFGLRTMIEQGRLTRTEVPNVEHGHWLHQDDLIQTYILPLIV